MTKGSCCQPHSAVSSDSPTDAPGLYLPAFKYDIRRDWILELATPWMLEPQRDLARTPARCTADF
eukprot:2155134-Pyramimonas_sp.AAC.1